MKRVFETLTGCGFASLAPSSVPAELKEQINLKVVYKSACRWLAYNQYRNRLLVAAAALILSGYTMTIVALSMFIKL